MLLIVFLLDVKFGVNLFLLFIVVERFFFFKIVFKVWKILVF